MASRGYYPPGAGKPKQASQAPVQKKADPYTLDQERKNPDVTDYDRSESALEHEVPDTRAEWQKDERNTVGLPAPSAEASKKVQAPKPVTRAGLHEKEAAQIKAHAGRCLRLSKSMVPPAVWNSMAAPLREDLLMRQAEDLMSLPHMPLQRIQMRIDELQRRARLLEKQAAPPMPEAEPVSQLPSPEPAGDEGEGLLEEADAAQGGEGAGEEGVGEVPPECQIYVDKALAQQETHEESESPAEEAAEQAEGEVPTGEDLEMPDLSELDSTFGGGGEMMAASVKRAELKDMTDKKDEDPSDEDLLGMLDERMSSAPAPKPAAKPAPKASRIDVLKKKVQAGAASPQEYAEYQKILRAPQASAKLAVLQKLVQAGKATAAQYALYQKMRSADKLEDSVRDVEKPAEDYHNEDASAYTEPGSNSAKGVEQLQLSNPLAAAVGPRSRKADGETANPDSGGINPWSDEDQHHDTEQHAYPPDEKPNSIKFEEQMELSNPVASAPSPEDGDDALTAALMEDSLRKASRDGGKNFDPNSLSEDVLAFISTKDASRAPTIAKDGQPQGTQPVAKVASRKIVPMQPRTAAVPPKRGVRTVAGLGRTAATQPGNEINNLSNLWKSAPDISKAFGNV